MIAPRRKSVAELTMLHKNVMVPAGRQAGVLSQRFFFFLKSYDKTANETVKKPYSSGYQLQRGLFILCNYRRRYFNAFSFFSFVHFLYLLFIYIYFLIFLETHFFSHPSFYHFVPFHVYITFKFDSL